MTPEKGEGLPERQRMARACGRTSASRPVGDLSKSGYQHRQGGRLATVSRAGFLSLSTQDLASSLPGASQCFPVEGHREKKHPRPRTLGFEPSHQSTHCLAHTRTQPEHARVASSHPTRVPSIVNNSRPQPLPASTNYSSPTRAPPKHSTPGYPEMYPPGLQPASQSLPRACSYSKPFLQIGRGSCFVYFIETKKLKK